MLCFALCARLCVLHVFCPCFRFCLPSFGCLGSPNLLADPRRDPLLLLHVLSCPCLSSSSLRSCRRPSGSKSCVWSLLAVLILCPAVHPNVLPPNAAHVFPCYSWLVLGGGVGCGGVGGGGFDSGVSCSACLLFLVPSRGLSVPSFGRNIACIKLIHAMVSGSLASRGWSVPSLDHRSARVALARHLVSCSFGRFVFLGDMCRPGCLVLWQGAEGCRAHSLRCVAFGVYFYSSVVLMAAILVDTLYCYIARCCDDGVDEMDATIAPTYYSGLSHAGDEHYSSLPDSATYMFATLRFSNSTLKFGRQIDCVTQEDGLYVAKALGHPKPIGAGCPLGEGIGGAIRLTNALGLRVQRPEQQPGEPHSPLGPRLGTSEIGSEEVPFRPAPITAQEDSGWMPGVAHREVSVASWREGEWRTQGPQKKVRHGVEDLESDSHRLRGSRCSNWTPRTLGLGYLKFHQNSPADVSTLGIELRLLPGSRFLASLEFGEIWTIAESRLTNSCLAVNRSQVHSGTLGGFSCLLACKGEVDWSLGRMLWPAWGMGSLRWKMIGLGLHVLVWRRAYAPPNSARGGKEIPCNFQIWTFVKRFSTRHSEDPKTPNTGPSSTNSVFMLKIVVPTYGFDVGNGCDSISEILGHFLEFSAEPFGWPVNVEPGSCECPSEINVDISRGVDVEHVVAIMVRTRPVVRLSWRKFRWLKRRGMAMYRASYGPPFGSTSQVVGCIWSHASVVDADVVVDGECDGHQWCHKRIKIGHGTCHTRSCSVAICRPSGQSSCLSSCLFFCPPLERSAPGLSFFPSRSTPLPPAHSALGGDDVGDRLLSFGADASVARPCLSVPSVSFGSSVSPLGAWYLVGPCKLPSRSGASTHRSVGFHQGESGNVSAQGGRRIAAASIEKSSIARARTSDKVVFNRQVTIVDLGLVDSNVAIHKPMARDKQTFGSPSADGDTGGCLFLSALGGAVVGSVASGRQPHKLPCGLHCVLRLRGGASSIRSSDDGLLGSLDVSRARSVDLVNEAVGSGFGDDRGNLNDDRGKATHDVFGSLPRVTEVSKSIGAPVEEESSVMRGGAWVASRSACRGGGLQEQGC